MENDTRPRTPDLKVLRTSRGDLIVEASDTLYPWEFEELGVGQESVQSLADGRFRWHKGSKTQNKYQAPDSGKLREFKCGYCGAKFTASSFFSHSRKCSKAPPPTPKGQGKLKKGTKSA